MNNETFDPGIDNLPGPVDGYDSESMDIAKLELLSQREQLMEDIESIIESKYGHTADDAEDLIVMLCDAVCKNFPAQ